MLDPDKALKQIMSFKRTPQTEDCPVTEALNRVLTEEIFSPLESPPFDKAAMDGYAVRGSDPTESYRIIETIAAGATPEHKVGHGECSKIMTGAMMPKGADKVIRVEFTEEREGRMRLTKNEPYSNVIKRGENLKIGEAVLSPRVLCPQDIGVLSSLGLKCVKVAKKPLVGVIATGSEIKEPGDELSAGQIYNSNGCQLRAQILAMGCRCEYYGIAPDEPAQLGDIVERRLAECDVLLLSGGVSMGSYDYVPEMLAAKGVKIHFHKLAIKPGKPTLFGQRDDCFVYGLPGNPVSTFVIFEVLVKPFLYGLMGFDWTPGTAAGRLMEDFTRRETVRTEYLPVIFTDGKIHTVSYHGSSHLNALSETNALVRIDRGIERIEKGTTLHARFIRR